MTYEKRDTARWCIGLGLFGWILFFHLGDIGSGSGICIVY